MAVLGLADIVVCILYFVVTILIGLRSGANQSESTDEYFVAGRSMGRFAVGSPQSRGRWSHPDATLYMFHR